MLGAGWEEATRPNRRRRGGRAVLVAEATTGTTCVVARTGETGGVSFSKSEEEEPVEVVGEGGWSSDEEDANEMGVVGEDGSE